MTFDTGFVPNPFHGVLSLATCKTDLRRLREMGDDIAGFTLGKLCGDPVGQERKVLLARVAEKLTFEEYWKDLRFPCKKTDWSTAIGKRGDNIYYPLWQAPDGSVPDFQQVSNPFHPSEERKDDDLSGIGRSGEEGREIWQV